MKNRQTPLENIWTKFMKVQMKNQRFVLISYLIYLGIISLLLFSYSSLDYNAWIKFFSYIAISHVFVTFICFRASRIPLFSVSTFFVGLSYLFHLGQVLLKGVTKKNNYNFDVSTILPEDTYKKAVLFSLFIISCVAIGILLSTLVKRKNLNEVAITIHEGLQDKILALAGWVIVFFTFPLEVYYSYKKIIVSMQSGYVAALNVQSSGILSIFAQFHLLGFALLIMVYSRRPYKANMIFLFYTIYSVITMLSGSRIYQTVSILVLLLILINSTGRKIRLKQGLIIVVSLFFLVSLLNVIADIRGTNARSFDVLSKSFMHSLSDNPIFGIINELGATIYTVGLTILKVPSSIDYSYGVHFLESFATVLPNIKGIFTEIIQKTNYVLLLQTEGIGGSYIGELYYSSPYASYFVAIILGYILGKISKKFGLNLVRRQYYRALFYVMPIFSLYVWVRGTSTVLLRNSIWSMVFIYVIFRFFSYILKTKTKPNQLENQPIDL
jgi:hypothetical protein